jgi:site-specific DNA recombinase
VETKLDTLPQSLPYRDSDSTLCEIHGIDSEYMRPDSSAASNTETNREPIGALQRRTRAVFYARVSSDTQQKEGTIESQVATLRRQIVDAGHELVKEYIDDGYSGTLLARPALDQMRSDLKMGLFDAVYFLAADRIARDVSYQRIIVGELIKHGKQIIINGVDYRNDPENIITLTILGAVAEFERAKIIERMMRGKLHKLRKGEMVYGQPPFGYEHVRKTASTPATLALKEPGATTVRSIFEMYDNGVSVIAITRWLQRNEIKTKFGKDLWTTLQVRNILRCRTYTGNRYYRPTNISDAVVPKHKRGPSREPSEIICIKVPAIVSEELFDRVQAKIQHVSRRYKQPDVRHLLGSMIQCGECGSGFHSYRRYTERSLLRGTRRIAHKAAYKCNWRVKEKQHLLDRITRCHNPEVATHLLDGKVMEMIRDTLLVPENLQMCMEGLECGKNDKHENLVQKLARFTDRIAGVEAEKQKSIDLYAAGGLTKEAYVSANLTLDEEIKRLQKRKVQIGKELQEAAANDMVDHSIREYCERAKEGFAQCGTFDITRQFLLDHVQRIVYLRGKVTILGSVPVKRGTFQAAVPIQFRIEGELDRKAIRAKPRKLLPDDGRWKKLNERVPQTLPAAVQGV